MDAFSTRSIESIPWSEFRPPHCPNPACRHFLASGPDRFPWHRHGRFVRASDGRIIPRFRCRDCRRTFSQQTFATSYWLRRRDLFHAVAAQLVAGSCLRQIARTLGCAHGTVARHGARLGRHAILLLASLLETLERRGGLAESLLWDHFETFAICQLLPLGLGTLVAATSGLVLWIDPVIHARGGRKTPAQQKTWQALLDAHGPPPRARYRRGTQIMLERMLAIETRPTLHLVTDGHPAYRRAVALTSQPTRIHHEVHPSLNPRQRRDQPRRARRRDRALRPIDTLHKLWRHTHAHDRRETLAFARRHNAAAERAFLIAAWRNWIKPCSERRARRPTPAQRAGLARRALTWAELLARRLFPGRLRVPDPWLEIYRRALTWPPIRNWARHDLKYAF